MFASTQSPVDRFMLIFPMIVFEALPFIIIGALISGTLEELLPQKWFARYLPKKRWLAIAGSSLLGLVFPMCECGIVPVMRRLLGKGLPLGCAVAYMLAAPIINPVVITSTWAAFSGGERVDGLTSWQMTTLRVGLSFITAFIVGLWINALERRHGTRALVQPFRGMTHRPAGQADDQFDATQATTPTMKKTTAQRIYNITDVALHDFIDITCFLILGAMLAGVVQALEIPSKIPGITENPVIAVIAMMVIAVMLCLCSEADAFVAANMPMVPLAGKLGFLVLGPMLDIKLYLMYTRVFRARLIWNIIILVVILVFCLSLGAHYLDQANREFLKPR